jgi:hypothetical protein
MKPTIASPALTISAALLVGCAGMSEAECRSASWYELGYRDARFKLQSQDAVYAAQCERHGATMDTARYNEGFRQGRWDFPDRTPL